MAALSCWKYSCVSDYVFFVLLACPVLQTTFEISQLSTKGWWSSQSEGTVHQSHRRISGFTQLVNLYGFMLAVRFRYHLGNLRISCKWEQSGLLFQLYNSTARPLLLCLDKQPSTFLALVIILRMIMNYNRHPFSRLKSFRWCFVLRLVRNSDGNTSCMFVVTAL